MRGGKGRHPLAPRSNSRKAGKGLQLHPPAAGIIDLRHKADIGQAGAVAMAKRLIGALGQHPFYPMQAQRDEMGHPPVKRGRAAKVDRMARYPQITHGLNFHRNCMGQGAGLTAGRRIGWQKTAPPRFIQIFQNRQGLRQAQPVNFKRGHQPLRIGRKMRRAALLARHKINRNPLII